MMPAISVLLPVKNGGPWFALALRSILGQTFRDFELLILDDGSTDGSREIAAGFAAHDQRVMVVAADRGSSGLAARLNQGISLARGRYLARMDADDISLPERFAKQVAYLEANPAVTVLGTGAVAIDPDGDPLYPLPCPGNPENLAAYYRGETGGLGGLPHPSVMMRTDFVKALGGYRIPEPVEDLALWLAVLEAGGTLACLPEILLQYRLHPRSISHERRAEQARLHREVVNTARQKLGLSLLAEEAGEKNGPPLGTPQPDPSFLARHWSHLARAAGFQKSARKHAWRAFREAPANRSNWWALLEAWLGERMVDRLKKWRGKQVHGRDA